MSDDGATRETASGGEPDFEAALDELRDIVADLEGGSLGLEASLVRFEAGVSLLKTCQATLNDAERRVELLTGEDADGNPVTEPFDASATAGRGGAGRRANTDSPPRRNRKRKAEPEEEFEGLF